MKKILFIGSFLSSTRGSVGIAESLAFNLKNENLSLKLVSKKENKIYRILEIIWATFMTNSQKIHIDIFSNSAFNIADIASKIAKIRGKKIIFTLHGGKLPEFAAGNIQKIKTVFSRANYIQTPSLYLKNYFENLGFDIHYLPNSIKLENFPYNREGVKPYSILWVRAFIDIYNPDIAVKILSQLIKKYPQATLTMVGPDKGLLKDILTFADSLGIQNAISVIGSVPNKELYKYYQTHQVYINTTSYESFGVANLEAASCGMPIVSNSVGEIPFLWKHNENAMLVSNQNIEEYVKFISIIFDNKDFENKISLQARKKAEEFSWGKIKPLWYNLLME